MSKSYHRSSKKFDDDFEDDDMDTKNMREVVMALARRRKRQRNENEDHDT